MTGWTLPRPPGPPPSDGQVAVATSWHDWPGPVELQYYRRSLAPMLWLYLEGRWRARTWQAGLVRYRARNGDLTAYCCELPQVDGTRTVATYLWSDALRLAVPPVRPLGPLLFPARRPDQPPPPRTAAPGPDAGESPP